MCVTWPQKLEFTDLYSNDDHYSTKFCLLSGHKTVVWVHCIKSNWFLEFCLFKDVRWGAPSFGEGNRLRKWLRILLWTRPLPPKFSTVFQVFWNPHIIYFLRPERTPGKAYWCLLLILNPCSTGYKIRTGCRPPEVHTNLLQRTVFARMTKWHDEWTRVSG